MTTADTAILRIGDVVHMNIDSRSCILTNIDNLNGFLRGTFTDDGSDTDWFWIGNCHFKRKFNKLNKDQ